MDEKTPHLLPQFCPLPPPLLPLPGNIMYNFRPVQLSSEILPLDLFFFAMDFYIQTFPGSKDILSFQDVLRISILHAFRFLQVVPVLRMICFFDSFRGLAPDTGPVLELPD